MSYVNMILYGAVIPSYSGEKNKQKEDDKDIIRGDDPKNQERIKQLFRSIQ